MHTLDDVLMRFSERYDEHRSLLCIMTTGGAMSISKLGTVPGASKRLAAIIQPYSMRELWRFVGEEVQRVQPEMTEADWRSVHDASAIHYLHALMWKYPGVYPVGYEWIAATAALETTRRRRGENVMYVAKAAAGDGKSLWKIVFEKFEDHNCATFHNEDGSSYTQTPDEVWTETFTYQSGPRKGQPKLDALYLHRRGQDERMTQALLALILKDPKFAQLNAGDKIIKLGASSGSTSRAPEPFIMLPNGGELWAEG